MKAELNVLEMPDRDLMANRIASLYLGLCNESPKYTIVTMQMLIDLLEEYDESYYILKGIEDLERSKHWLEKAFEDYLQDDITSSENINDVPGNEHENE